MNDYLAYAANYINYIYTSSSYGKSYIYYGPIMFRFLQTNSYNCLTDYDTMDLFTSMASLIDTQCYYSDHYDNNRNQSGIYKYSFVNETNITHPLVTPIGKYDTTGTVIFIYPNE